jgi:hypothetical protein
VTGIFLVLVLIPLSFSPAIRQASMLRSCRHERVSTVFLMNGGIGGLLKTFCNQSSNMHGPSRPPQANYARLYPNLKFGQSLGLVSAAHAIHLDKSVVLKDLDKKQLTYRADNFHERNLLSKLASSFKLSTGLISTLLWDFFRTVARGGLSGPEIYIGGAFSCSSMLNHTTNYLGACRRKYCCAAVSTTRNVCDSS